MKSILKKIIVSVLTVEAKLILWRHKPNIVAITGSVGKTSTKDAIYTVLSEHFFTRKSEKSFNTEFGVPLTIIGGRNGWSNPLIWIETICKGLGTIFLLRYPEWLVLEIGADRPGDIRNLSSWVKPNIAVMTRLGEVPVHVEFFKSRKALIDEKAYVPKSLKDAGVLVLNADDPDILNFKVHAKGSVVTYGAHENANVVASNYTPHYEGHGSEKTIQGFSFKANIRGNSLPVIRKGLLGSQHMYPALAALAVASALDLNLIKATEALAREILPPGRMRIIQGIRNSMIIDDSYNSSPVALSEALTAFKDIVAFGRKISVLGDMLELGKLSSQEHRMAGEQAAGITDVLVTVGVRADHIAEGARSRGMKKSEIYQFENSRDAARFLDVFVGKGDVVLVKGSQGMRMERVVEEIMAHPEDKEVLLVRQDAEWLKR